MRHILPALTALVLVGIATPSSAQSDTQVINALKDSARAQQSQADSLRRMESLDRDRARAADTARHNAERDSRSLRRFDR